jgi:hypothetical protein
MKASGLILTAIMLFTLAMAGCSKQGSIDVASFEQKLKSAEAAAQASAEKAINAIKTSDYPGALKELKTLAGNAKLTAEQQRATKDLMAQLQKFVAVAGGTSAGDATKAVKDVPKALPK